MTDRMLNPLYRLLALPIRITDKLCSALYRDRHPTPIERFLLDSFRVVVRQTQINDKWNLKWHLPRMFRNLQPSSPNGRHVFIFCAYRIEFTLNLALAALLWAVGYRITIGYLPKLRSPTKRPLEDHPSAKTWLRYALADLSGLTGGMITAVDLTKEPVEIKNLRNTAEVERSLCNQAYADAVMVLRRETLDLEERDTGSVYRYLLDLGKQSRAIAMAHFRSRPAYDIVLVPNGTTFEAAQIVAVATEAKYPVNTFEKFAFRNRRIINHGSNFLSWRTLEKIWSRRAELGYASKEYSSAVIAEARRLISERKNNSTETWAWSLQTAEAKGIDETLASVGLSQSRPFILVCTNVPYDAGYEGLQTIFGSMKEWLVESIAYLLENSSYDIIVRCHPGEAAHYGGKERSEENIAAAGLDSSRLIVLPGDYRINTYTLMDACAFGVVFSSTTGMEMAIMGKSVVVGGGVYYSKRGFTVDAESRHDYFQNIKRYCNDPSLWRLTEAQAEEAARFHFILHFVMQQHYPYDNPSGVLREPPSEVVSSPEFPRYKRVLELLCISETELDQRLADFFHAQHYVRTSYS